MKRSCLILMDDNASASMVRISMLELDFDIIDEAMTLGQADTFLSERVYTVVISNVLVSDYNAIDFFKAYPQQLDRIIYIAKEGHERFFQRAQTQRYRPFLMSPVHKLTLKSIVKLLERHTREYLDSVRPDILVKSEEGVHKVNTRDVLFIKSMRNDCEIYTEEGAFHVRKSLASYEKSLGDSQFMRIHRSYLINLDQISSVRKAERQLTVGEYQLPIGKRFKKEFLERYFELN